MAGFLLACARSERLAPAGLLLCALACATPVTSREHVSLEGYRGVRFGMSLAEASAAYGARLDPAGPPEDPDAVHCDTAYPRGGSGAVSFMVVEGEIARVDVDGAGVATAEGVGVGSLESEVLAAYGSRAQVSPHKYTGPEGHYVTVRNGNAALIFETDGARVTRYRAGRLPEVEWVEGCA